MPAVHFDQSKLQASFSWTQSLPICQGSSSLRLDAWVFVVAVANSGPLECLGDASEGIGQGCLYSHFPHAPSEAAALWRPVSAP